MHLSSLYGSGLFDMFGEGATEKQLAPVKRLACIILGILCLS
jgi:hypothetical protein